MHLFIYLFILKSFWLTAAACQPEAGAHLHIAQQLKQGAVMYNQPAITPSRSPVQAALSLTRRLIWKLLQPDAAYLLPILSPAPAGEERVNHLAALEGFGVTQLPHGLYLWKHYWQILFKFQTEKQQRGKPGGTEAVNLTGRRCETSLAVTPSRVISGQCSHVKQVYRISVTLWTKVTRLIMLYGSVGGSEQCRAVAGRRGHGWRLEHTTREHDTPLVTIGGIQRRLWEKVPVRSWLNFEWDKLTRVKTYSSEKHR